MSSAVINPELGQAPGIQSLNGVRQSRGVAEVVQQQIKTAVHKELIKRLDLDKLSDIQETQTGQKQLFTLIQQLLMEQGIPLSGAERDRLAQEVVDEVFGFGPLEPLLNDNTVSDILVEHLQSGVCGASRQTREDQRGLQRQQALDAHHRQDCVRSRPAHR